MTALSGSPTKTGRHPEAALGDLRRLLWSSAVRVQARQDLAREGDAAQTAMILLEGWACRYKLLPDGRRQTVAFLIPGDVCIAGPVQGAVLDHMIGAVTEAIVGHVAHGELGRMIESSPALAESLRRHESATPPIQREWILSLGQRTAYERVAHLMCEMFVRMRSVGLTDGSSFCFPLTQADIADAVGLTPVHVNRMLQALRSDGLVSLARRTLTIADPRRLMEAASFRSDYLQLGGGEDQGGDG